MKHECVASVTLALAASASAGILFHEPGESPYLGPEDSPWAAVGHCWDYFHLEDFEDGALSTPGVSISAGDVRFPDPSTDSVDADDGVIDGAGADGHAFFQVNPAGAVFMISFDDVALGVLPTHAGVVWTDGNDTGMVTFTAYDAAGDVLDSFDAALGDGVHDGSTAADRFLGVEWQDGLSAIEIRASIGSMEIDHIQYGYAPCQMDIDGSGDVGFTDLLEVLSFWGPCISKCCMDTDGSGDVGFADLLNVLSFWGPCAAGG